MFDVAFDEPLRVGIAYVGSLHVRLCQKAVVDGQMGVEAYAACRRKKQVFFSDPAGRTETGDETAKMWDDYAVVAQEEALDMSGEFKHTCKDMLFF